jgi:hypothetical protein
MCEITAVRLKIEQNQLVRVGFGQPNFLFRHKLLRLPNRLQEAGKLIFNNCPLVSTYVASFYAERLTQFCDPRPLSHQDNRSRGPANTGQHISSIFLFGREPGFYVHLNRTA